MIKDNQIRVSKPQIKIPEVRFNLKSHKKGDKEVLIIAVFRYEGKRLLYTTAKHVNPKYWNKKTNRCKESVDYTDGHEINNDLENIRSIIRDTYKNQLALLDVTTTDFKKELDYKLRRKERPSDPIPNYKDFYSFIEAEKQKNKDRVGGRTGGQTWQKLGSILKRLKAFATYKNVEKWEYSDITEEFKDEFVSWLHSKELAVNSINKDIVTIKNLLKKSRKYHSNKYYLDEDFKVDRIKIPKNFPTLSELKTLFNHEFKNPRHEKAADLYLISAFGGGLRWSDVKKLSKDNLTENDGIPLLQVFTYKGRNTKDDNEVIVPITPQLQKLIDKYQWNFPNVPEQEVNRMIKKAFEKAELKRKVQIKSSVLEGQTETKELHEVITFHTARYAYINFMINDLEVSPHNLQKITGQSLKILMGYENGNKKKNATNVGAKINHQLQGLQIVKKSS